MPIIVNLDVVMAQRKISATQLAEKVGITLANLSILKNNKAKAIRFFHAGGIVPCATLPARRFAGIRGRKRLSGGKSMNQDPTGNKPLSSSKPPVYIPPGAAARPDAAYVSSPIRTAA